MARTARNLRSTLTRRRCQGDAMAAYDRLPPPLRAWLAQAALPWSPRSAQRLWQKTLDRSRGDISAALAHLAQAEARMLARDRPY